MRLLKKYAMLFGILVVAFVFIGGMIAVSNRNRVLARIEEIRLAGDPTSMNEVLSAAVDPQDDAATHLVDAIESMSELYNQVWKDLDESGFDWKQGVGEQKFPELKREFDQHQDLATALAKAAQSDGYRWSNQAYESPTQWMEAQIELVGNLRTVARYSRILARYLAAQGQPDQAAMVCVDQLRLCRLQDEVPLLIGFLMNTACRGTALDDLNGLLQYTDLSAATHGAIENELAKHDSMDRFVHALKTERAYGIESIRTFPISPTNYLDVMNEQIAIAADPHDLAISATLVPATGLAALVVPAIDQARAAMNRNLATIRCVRVLNAIKRKPDQAESESLRVESLGLPSGAIIDPFTGGNLAIKATEHGWIVYSLGTNATDDGGSVGDESDIGIAPPAVKE